MWLCASRRKFSSDCDYFILHNAICTNSFFSERPKREDHFFCLLFFEPLWTWRSMYWFGWTMKCLERVTEAKPTDMRCLCGPYLILRGVLFTFLLPHRFYPSSNHSCSVSGFRFASSALSLPPSLNSSTHLHFVSFCFNVPVQVHRLPFLDRHFLS